MKKSAKTTCIKEKRDKKPADADSIARLIVPCLLRSPACSVKLYEEEIEALLSIGKETTEPLLTALSRHCADLYEIRNYMWELLDDEKYRECHHVLPLLYAACREPTHGFLALVACSEETLVPYMLVLGSIPLMGFMIPDWYDMLMNTLPGKITLAIVLATVLVTSVWVSRAQVPAEGVESE